MDDFVYITDRADLRSRYTRRWVYFSERTGMHVAVQNPRLEPDDDLHWMPTHDGIAVLPGFADPRTNWAPGWLSPTLCPTVTPEAGDEYDADVYDALREADWSD